MVGQADPGRLCVLIVEPLVLERRRVWGNRGKRPGSAWLRSSLRREQPQIQRVATSNAFLTTNNPAAQLQSRNSYPLPAQFARVMSSMPNEIILFHYPFSPYAHRVIWYLQLRGIAFAQCVRPLPPAASGGSQHLCLTAIPER